MGIRGLVADYLPQAVIASVIFTLFNIYTGEITTLVPLVADFLLHVCAIFVGFVVFDAIWHKIFNGSEA